MNRASSIEIRKSLEATDAMVKAGICFIPVAVFTDDQKNEALILNAKNLEFAINDSDEDGL